MSDLRDTITDEFQYTVENLLVRNKSILDQLTKYQDTCGRVNRTLIKSCTQCGCIKINAQKQNYDIDMSLDTLQEVMNDHTEGALCENCRDLLEKEIGRNLFYLASLCNTLDLNMYDILLKEVNRLKMLGKFNLR